MEAWHLAIAVGSLLAGIGGILTPFILAARSRDSSLISMINTAKDDAVTHTKTVTDPIHERINRMRDEYVREDHLQDHLARIDKQFDNLNGEIRRNSDKVDKGFDEMRRLLQGRKPD